MFKSASSIVLVVCNIYVIKHKSTSINLLNLLVFQSSLTHIEIMIDELKIYRFGFVFLLYLFIFYKILEGTFLVTDIEQNLRFINLMCSLKFND